MDQHPYFIAVLAVAVPAFICLALRALRELVGLVNEIELRRQRKEAESAQASDDIVFRRITKDAKRPKGGWTT
ncbi:hypothetical protein [Streptacidiphilus carbonis]|uniref:hypothetical protein n=1 Tax=Streptacidiphilus carbonis TaxID=105422 RepID=UPI0005A782A2|nr:hypothetical protein [Streptacidiphilus carbonis]